MEATRQDALMHRLGNLNQVYTAPSTFLLSSLNKDLAKKYVV